MAGMRVAIIGARGIGKQHAKWFAMCGCEVVAFVGANPERTNSTAAALKQLFDFCGRGYTDCEAMLRNEHPDMVSVCSPHALHYEHTMLALQYGAHVLCEKPMIWDPALNHQQILLRAREMIESAKRYGRLLAVNTQYAALVPYLREIYVETRGNWDAPHNVIVRMDARILGRDERGVDMWMDLGPHPLSVLLRLMPQFEIVEGTLRGEAMDSIIHVEFTARYPFKAATAKSPSTPEDIDVERKSTAGYNDVSCTVELQRHPPEAGLQRYVNINGLVVHIAGRNDERGIYRAYLSWDDNERQYEDFMHTSIRHFVDAVRGCGELLCTGEEGYRNLECQLEILRAVFNASSD